MNFRDIPKIELHCHLDGSMSIDVTSRLLQEKGIDMPEEELKGKLEAPDDCSSLAEYLERFDLPIRRSMGWKSLHMIWQRMQQQRMLSI